MSQSKTINIKPGSTKVFVSDVLGQSTLISLLRTLRRQLKWKTTGQAYTTIWVSHILKKVISKKHLFIMVKPSSSRSRLFTTITEVLPIITLTASTRQNKTLTKRLNSTQTILQFTLIEVTFISTGSLSNNLNLLMPTMIELRRLPQQMPSYGTAKVSRTKDRLRCFSRRQEFTTKPLTD